MQGEVAMLVCCIILSKQVPRWPSGQNFAVSVVKSKTEKLAPVASLVSVHHLSPRAGLVGPLSV